MYDRGEKVDKQNEKENILHWSEKIVYMIGCNDEFLRKTIKLKLALREHVRKRIKKLVKKYGNDEYILKSIVKIMYDLKSVGTLDLIDYVDDNVDENSLKIKFSRSYPEEVYNDDGELVESGDMIIPVKVGEYEGTITVDTERFESEKLQKAYCKLTELAKKLQK